jgi:hypothetical protein
MTMPQVIAMGIANALPGCEAQNFATEGTTVLKGRVMGWGPSLHRIGMAWAVTPASMTSEDVGAALEPYLAVQRRRIETARALGLATDRQPEPGDLSHLLTDALLLGWDKDLRNAVPRQLARLKQMSRPGRERIVGMGDMTIAEAGALSGDDDLDPRPRLLYRNPTEWGEFDGRSVIVHRRLPDSVLPSLPGMRLGDVLDLGDGEPCLVRLANRTITGADMHEGTLLINTRPEWTAFPKTSQGDGK